MQPTESQTIQSALSSGYELLSPLPGYRLEVELLLAHLLHVSRTYLYIHSDQSISKSIYEQLVEFCLRRSKGEPLAYLLGTKEFWSLELEVNHHTLIPRPETELLVELTLDLLPKNRALTIADLGVGSGAIAIAIAMERPNWQIYGTDNGSQALEVAERNVIKHARHNITLVQSNWCLNLPIHSLDAIISNPPYIAKNDPHLAKLKFEPIEALVSGEDGLDDIRQIISQATHYLKEGGWLLLEHGYDQAQPVQKLMHHEGFVSIKSHPDLNGILRVTSCRWKSYD